MKLHTITAALAAAGLGFAGATAQAQGISDDVIRVGFITDMSGVYSDIDGKGGLEAVRMAIEDAGGSINGKKIEVVSADHQNKADVASARVREWFDEQKVDVIIAGTNSSTSLAMAGVAGEKKSPSSPSARAPRPDQCPVLALYRALRLRHRGAGARHRLGGGEGRRQELVLPDRRLRFRPRAGA